MHLWFLHWVAAKMKTSLARFFYICDNILHATPICMELPFERVGVVLNIHVFHVFMYHARTRKHS